MGVGGVSREVPFRVREQNVQNPKMKRRLNHLNKEKTAIGLDQRE
jgi:hypothetical protein